MITTREVDGIFSIIWMSALLSVATFSSPVSAVKIQRLIEMMTSWAGSLELAHDGAVPGLALGYGISGAVPHQIAEIEEGAVDLQVRDQFPAVGLATALTPGTGRACESRQGHGVGSAGLP